MARRKVSTQARVAAAAVSLAVAGVLAGFMAARDHTANATPQSSPSSNDTGAFDAPSGSTATPSPGDGFDNGGDTGSSPQPQTRSGGS